MSRFAEGDRVEVTITGEVTGVGIDGGIQFLTVNEDVHVSLGVADYIKVRKLARPKPQVGDELTGHEVSQVMWKRGSMICVSNADRRNALVLFADGLWRCVSYPADVTYKFAGDEDADFYALSPTAKFTVLHVA